MTGGAYNLYYAIVDARQNLRENLITNLLAAVTVGFSLAICALFVIVLKNLNVVVETWGERTHIVAYVKDGTLDKLDSKALVAELTALAGVESVSFTSKEAALKELKKELKGHEGIIEGIGSNPLPASFDIMVTPTKRTEEGIGSVAKEVSTMKWVEELQYGHEWVERFAAFLRFIKMAAFVVAVFLTAAMLFVISNTIRLTVYARRDEVEVMRLVGASDMYIKVPFFLEGVVQGFLGGVFALGMLAAGRYLVSLQTPEYFNFVIENPFSLTVLFIMLTVSGMALGAIGSLVSLGRFLNT